MAHAVLLDRRASAPDQQPTTDVAECEASEVALLLMRAGVDHASSLWFQLLELATQEACDWTERAEASHAPIGIRTAAILGLRALAAEILSSAPEQDEAARGAAEACLAICAEAVSRGAEPPQRQRRWGEGAVPQPPQHSRLLERAAGCC
jgi:hypothetical protein